MKLSTFKKAITYISAGKLAIGISTANAGGLGKADNASPTVSSLSMDQIGYPIEILTPPIIKNNLALSTEGSGKLGSSAEGFLYSKDISTAIKNGLQPRIDFIVGGMQNDSPTVVFLAYSTRLGSASQWLDFPLNNFELDRETLKIIGAFQTEPVRGLEGFTVEDTPLGSLPNQGNSFIIRLNLTDISTLNLENNAVYFQAVSVPLINGELVFAEAIVSEVDTFLKSDGVSADGHSGSKIVTDGSKTTDTGSKTTGSTDSGGSKTTNTADTGGK